VNKIKSTNNNNMTTSNQWKTTSSVGKLNLSQLQEWAPMLRYGLEDQGSWGYGVKRLMVKESSGTWPMVFSAMGYKNQEGVWYLALRMNVDQASPIKFKIWRRGDNIVNILTNMMSEHMQEFGCKGNFGSLV